MRLGELLNTRPPTGTKFKRRNRVVTLGPHEPRPPFVLLDPDGKEAVLTDEEHNADDWKVQK